jgi:hypothetical protein
MPPVTTVKPPVTEAPPEETVRAPAEVIVPDPVVTILPEVEILSPAVVGCRVVETRFHRLTPEPVTVPEQVRLPLERLRVQPVPVEPVPKMILPVLVPAKVRVPEPLASMVKGALVVDVEIAPEAPEKMRAVLEREEPERVPPLMVAVLMVPEVVRLPLETARLPEVMVSPPDATVRPVIPESPPLILEFPVTAIPPAATVT